VLRLPGNEVLVVAVDPAAETLVTPAPGGAVKVCNPPAGPSSAAVSSSMQ